LQSLVVVTRLYVPAGGAPGGGLLGSLLFTMLPGPPPPRLAKEPGGPLLFVMLRARAARQG